MLEDAIRIEGEALAESAAPEAESGGALGGALAPGQRVRLATGSTGELLELRGDGKAGGLAGAGRMGGPGGGGGGGGAGGSDTGGGAGGGADGGGGSQGAGEPGSQT